MSVSSPYTAPKDWGTITIGGVSVPGVVLDIDGVSRPEKWVVQMGIAVSNAITVWRGTQIAEKMTISTNLPNDKAFQDYMALAKTLRPKIGSKPPALPIVNAAFQMAGINRVCVRDVLPPKAAGGLSWVGKIELIQFNPPKPAPVGPPEAPRAESENAKKASEVERLMNIARGF